MLRVLVSNSVNFGVSAHINSVQIPERFPVPEGVDS